jgi:hypothetical protein
MIPNNDPCVYLREGKCIAKCDGMCPKLRCQCIVDETCSNPPKQPSPYLDINTIRKDERDKVIDEVILRIDNLLSGLVDEKKKSFWFRLSQAKSNSTAEFTLRYVADMVEELRQNKDGEQG